ncbi:MAG: TetR/AcrR family transcriptional regulator [Clostridiales bacterium]|nr:TetR/AcrR family transcriptional regulator [Clostridiales bacterium]
MTEQKSEQKNTREQLIMAGISELSERGIADFSVRRTANRCGVSCAAPYKHFKDKQSFIAEIITYINRKWDERQRAAAQTAEKTRQKLIAVCMEFIRFLVENPQYRAIIMLRHDERDERFNLLRGQLSRQTYQLVSKYCEEVNMPPDVRQRKTFIVRSLIYGAALMFDNGELEYTDENLRMVSQSLEREFDLP